MKYIKVIAVIIVAVFLTLVTQVGGLIYLISVLVNIRFANNFKNGWSKAGFKISTFLILYLLGVFIIVPMIAKPLGRVQLPLFSMRNLQPATALTFFLNRNYVNSQLRKTVFEVSENFGREFPGTVVNYLDGNFPFIDKFPLLPHLSHNDGKKLDLSFSYREKKADRVTNQIPSFIGYGICEDPRPNEENKPEFCSQRGFWQYSFLQKIIPQNAKEKFVFDEQRTKRLVEIFAGQNAIARIFIEPHLKSRLGLTSQKVLFHGCHAVRHDDHFHVQLN